MTCDNDLRKLSDLVRLCAATMRVLAKSRCRDSAGNAGLEMVADLERIAIEMRKLAKSEHIKAAN